MEQLQADLMTKGVFTRYERRQIKTLTKANEAQRQYVKAALPANHLARRWMDTCGEVDQYGNIDYCGVPLCPRCHMRERAVQTGKTIKKIFCDAANEELAFATILLPPQLDFTGMTDLVENEKRRLRTFIDRQRKKDNRWNGFQLLGWWEIDRMSFGDFETCGRNTRLALDALGFPLMEAPDKTIWRPHLHAIIRKGGLTTEEIASALRKETHTAKYQVVIEPFRTYRDAGDNIQNIVRYCLKFRIECDYKRPDAQDFIEAEQADEAKPTERNWWPAEDIRAYVDWLCLERSGFRSLRVVIGQAKDKSASGVQRVTSSSTSIGEEIADGEKSTDAMPDRSGTRNHIVEMKVNSVVSDMNGIFVVEDSRGVSRSNADIRDAGNGVTRFVYNNIVQDTNWTDIDVDRLWPIDNRAAARAISKTSRYTGNVVSLSERLRSIMTSKQASGAQWGDMTQP
ncbi:hypothetical protein G6M17_11690 [Agrobacterium tumefaciens]|nr:MULTISPECIES: hypothetical protein [Rhizobium/Agrobacterium group]AQS61040.1 hypothetical protein B0909_01225 [Rhizobium rhizogenes]MCZ7445400.1 hypothetical protein [Rhizobium rhizogenes]NSZ79809.1 hypothetical protein [Agrobacterium tumefaciens]OAM63930.1 hypothetical protein A8L48_12250 [Rhizobium rhizogenes]